MIEKIDDELIWFLVRNYVPEHMRRNDELDFYQEARMAALNAIKTYDATRKTKVTTHIYNCVKNKLIDLTRESKYQVGDQLEREVEEVDAPSDFELIQTMKVILEDDEFTVFKLHFIHDMSLRQIHLKTSMTVRKIESCYNRILSKYRSLEENRLQALTLRRRQEMFVTTSAI